MSSSSSLSSSTTTTATTTSARIRLPSISELTSRSTISGGSNSGNGSALKSQISPRLSDTSRILPSILKNTSGSSTPTSSSTPFKCPPIKSTIGGSLSSGNTQSNYVLGNTKINNLPRLSSPTLPAKVQPQQQPHLPPASSLSPVTRVINTPPQQPQSVSASTSPNTQYQYYQYQQQSSPIQQQQQQQQATPAATPTVMQMAQNQPSHPAPLQYATQQYYPQPVYYQSPAGVPPPPPSVTHQGHIIAVHQHPGHLPQVGVDGMRPNVGYTIVQPEIVNKSTNRCHRCGTTETPEWRRGPKGVRTLCNACGLFHAKLVKRKGAALAAEEVLNNKVTKGKNGRRISMKKHLLNESLKQQQQINGVGIPINGFNHQILPPSFKPQQGGIATLPPLMHGQYPNNVNNLVIHQPPPPQQQQQQPHPQQQQQHMLAGGIPVAYPTQIPLIRH